MGCPDWGSLPLSPEGLVRWPPLIVVQSCSDPRPCTSAAPDQKHWCSLCKGYWYGSSDPVSNRTKEQA